MFSASFVVFAHARDRINDDAAKAPRPPSSSNVPPSRLRQGPEAARGRCPTTSVSGRRRETPRPAPASGRDGLRLKKAPPFQLEPAWKGREGREGREGRRVRVLQAF